MKDLLDVAIQIWPILVILLGLVGILIFTREKKKK